jgi:hypothetical protein
MTVWMTVIRTARIVSAAVLIAMRPLVRMPLRCVRSSLLRLA